MRIKSYTLVTSTITSVLLLSSAMAEKISTIRVEGNKRIESATIKSYLPLKTGETYSQEKADAALKDLFATGYFVDVKVFQEGGTLVVHVLENAMINRIACEGNNKISDEKLLEEVQLRPREVLSNAKIRAAQQRILEIYRRLGRFGAKVEPKVIELPQNRVDLVFEIDEGNVTYIRQINFIGNHHVSSSKLEAALLSKRTKWYRFFADDDTYDTDRHEADKQVLRQYYMNNGFPDFHLKSAVAELSPDGKDFYLTFTIDEGEQYTFGDISVVSEIPQIQSADYEDLVEISPGQIFSGKQIEKALSKISEAIGAHGYAFADVQPALEPDRGKKRINIRFEIKKGPFVYVERIDVIGNDRTRDHVIRREIPIHEGDAFNTVLLKKAEKNIRDLGYFKRVDIQATQGSAHDKAKVIIRVEEQPTGEMNIAGGYGTVDGILGKVSFSERNFMGKGQIVGAELSVARKFQEFSLGITEPYFMGRPLALGGDVYATRSHRFEHYVHTQRGILGHLGYDFTDTLSQTLSYNFHQDNVSRVRPESSIFIRNQAGRTFTSAVGQALTYDKRDSKIDPTKGFVTSLSNTFAGLGGNINYFKTILSGNIYYTPIEEVTFIVKASYGRNDKVQGKQIRIVDSFQLGASDLRGFEYGGVGPRAKDDPETSLGGTRYWTASVDVLFPIGLPNELGIKGAGFFNAGDLWKVGANTFGVRNQFGVVLPSTQFIEDKRRIRTAAGFGISWMSPFGPLRIDYAFPLSKTGFDRTQRILFGFSTRS